MPAASLSRRGMVTLDPRTRQFAAFMVPSKNGRSMRMQIASPSVGDQSTSDPGNDFPSGAFRCNRIVYRQIHSVHLARRVIYGR